MTPSKQAFGQFVALKRQSASLTQRELAERLFVTESAVSKWERGLSYPDITLVHPLARELGVTERELLGASDDHEGRVVERQALVYRLWRAAVLWTTLIAYAATALVCLIVNLASEHTLSWFWIVLAAVGVAFSLTTLPLLVPSRRGWWALLGCVASLFALLSTCQLLYGGGCWLPIPLAAITVAVGMIFAPLWLGNVLPEPAMHHRTVIALALDTVLVAGLVLLVLLVTGGFARLAGTALLIVALGAVFPWGAALAIRYLRVAGLYRAAAVAAFFGLYSFFGFIPLVELATSSAPRPIDLARWSEPYLNGNIELLVTLAPLVVAAALALTQALRTTRTDHNR
jgi:transcriptional regulator with XRE-family HTH domain